MIEHTQHIDENTIEIGKSASPLQHVMEIGEDLRQGETVLSKGSRLRSQEMGVLAALGKTQLQVYKQPRVAILSSGDEIVPIHETPGLSQLRDVNAHTLGGLVQANGGVPLLLGIAKDTFDDLNQWCVQALEKADMVLISGGSSVGTRDFTLEVLQRLPESEILVHGVSVSPGKPTILARIVDKPFWGLPGQVTSAMIVFHVLVAPCLRTIGGLAKDDSKKRFAVSATLSRNLSSVQGREDYIRVRLVRQGKSLVAKPILGKSGLLHTMVKAEGLIRIDKDSEGLDEGATVEVNLF
jgi:molybdopterin molybdotransferase